jgi:predicted DsbA family dithiol-disulfide isomerase
VSIPLLIAGRPAEALGKAEGVLKGDNGIQGLREAEEFSRRHRVDGVPFLIANGQTTLAGAQHPDTFLASFRQTLDPK